MKKYILYIVLLMFVAFNSNAANLFIEVKDHITNERLLGVNLKCIETNSNKKQAYSLAQGTVLLKDIQYPIKLICSYTGYITSTIIVQQKDVMSIKGQEVYSILLEKSVTQINELVVTGQVTPVMAKQSIYKVNSISNTEINQRAAVSLNDLLNYEMNNFVSNDNILGSSTNIGGIGGQNVKILVNGIPLMGRENGNIDMGQINLANIKRVEMIQGPMSVIYGSNALGGVINLITATPKKKVSIGARSYSESIGRYNVSGNFGLNKGKHQLQMSLARNFFAGWTPKDSEDRYQLWKPKTQYIGDFQYWWTYKKLKLNYFGSYLNEKISNKGEPIINPYEGYAFDEYYRTRRLINSVSATINLDSTDQLVLNNSFQSYTRIKNRFKKDLVTLTEFETENIGDQDTTKFYDFNSRGTFTSTRFKHVDVLAGYEYLYEKGISFKLTDAQQTMSEIAVFGSATYKYHKFQIQPSGRYTYNTQFKSSVSPAIHAKIDLNTQTQVRLSYARGFRAPTLKEMYLQFIDQNHTIIGNPDLKPEIGDHVEAGLDRQFTIKKANVSIGVNGYYNSIENLIALAVYNNHGVLRQYANVENYKNWILNLKGKYSLGSLSVSSGIGMIYVVKTNVTPQHNIFEYTLNGNYCIKPIKTTLNFNYKYNSRQPVITIDQQFLYTSPLHIANVSLQHSFLNKALQVQVGIKNLFNEQNSTLSGSIDAQNTGHSSSNSMQIFPERSYFVDLSYSF